MRPRDAIAPPPKVGVVAAAITDRPRQHAHPALHLSASLLSPRLNPRTARGSSGRARSGDRPIGEGGEREQGAANRFIPDRSPADMHAEWCSTPHLARLIPATPVGDTVMPDRRQVATRAIVAAGVYLHPN